MKISLMIRNLEFFVTMLSQAVIFIGSFASLKILTSLVEIEDVGNIALALTLSAFVGAFYFDPLYQAILRYGSEFQIQKREHELFKIIDLARVLGAIICFVLLILTYIYCYNYGELYIFPLIAVSVIYGLVRGSLSMDFGFISALKFRYILAVLQTGEVWFRILFVIITLYFFSKSAEYLFVAMIFSALIFSVFYRIVWKTKRKKYVFQIEKSSIQRYNELVNLFRFAQPFIGWAAVAMLSSYCDRWALASNLSTRDVAIYFAISQISNAPLSALTTALSQFFTPIVYGNVAAKNENFVKKNVLIIFYVSMIVSVVTLAILIIGIYYSKRIVTLLASGEYTLHSDAVPFLIFSSGLINIANFQCIFGLSMMKGKKYFLPKCYYGFFSVIFSFLGVYIFGFYGAVTSNVMSSAIYFVLVLKENIKIYFNNKSAPVE